jgi:hypothetical protein
MIDIDESAGRLCRYRAIAYKAHEAACGEEPEDFDSPLHAEWDARQEEACSAYCDAEWEMIQTIPTTRAGAIGMITAYLKQRDPFLNEVL